MKQAINLAFKVSIGILIGLVVFGLLMIVGIVPTVAQGLNQAQEVVVPYGSDVAVVEGAGAAFERTLVIITLAGIIIMSILQRNTIPVGAVERLLTKLREEAARDNRQDWKDVAVDVLDTGWLLAKGFINTEEKALLDAKRSGKSLTQISEEAESWHTSGNMPADQPPAGEPVNA